MTTCAVNVDYMHLSDIGRAYIEENYRRPIGERLLRSTLARVLTRPRLMQLALRLGSAARIIKPLLSSRLRAMLDLQPESVLPEILAAGVHRAEGDERRRVVLLAGCAQQALNANINGATIRLLRRHGCTVDIAAGAGCCGSLSLHMGRSREARRLARRNLDALTSALDRGADAIVINASGCGTTVKDYEHLFAQEPASRDAARRVATSARDVVELIEEIGLGEPVGIPSYRVAYHDPCSMRNVQKVVRQPRSLLGHAGLDVRDIPEAHFCCGSAGTFNILQPGLARQLGERKASATASVSPDFLVTGNIGCMIQIGTYLGDCPVVHTVEVLDWATGGPMPPALAGHALPERPVKRAGEPAGAQPVATTAIW